MRPPTVDQMRERTATPMSLRAVTTTILASLCALACGLALDAPAALACPNEEFRTGRSAALPDCRAYELVTPENLGRFEDMAFTGDDHAIPESNGEALALETLSPFGPQPSESGSRVVFSRTASGWAMRSIVPPGGGADKYTIRLLSPDLSDVAYEVEEGLNFETEYERSRRFEVGPVGGPYKLVAAIPPQYVGTGRFEGANAGTESVPPFSEVFFASEKDHELLPETTAEGKTERETVPGATQLYEWVEGRLRLAAVKANGELLSKCGAILGASSAADGAPTGTENAVSAAGSKMFITSPAAFEEKGYFPGCEEPPRLYMYVAGQSEPVEVSAPQGVALQASERREVSYLAATPDGSKVFFKTGTQLVPGGSGGGVYEYDTEAPMGERLKLIMPGVYPGVFPDEFLMSENGSVIYYGDWGIKYVYDATTGLTKEIEKWANADHEEEDEWVTPNGQYMLFSGVNLEREKRAPIKKDELYRYDNTTGNFLCVSCGPGTPPSAGEYLGPTWTGAVKDTPNESPRPVVMTENGQEVFFDTTQELLPQDTNGQEQNVKGFSVGTDVYEWEADGWHGCQAALGCTFLISSGETQGPSYLLGVSSNGRDVFFTSAAQMLPWATPEFTNIYDAREDGGFPPLQNGPECVTCQGVGSRPLVFSPGSSETFVGVGNVPPNSLFNPSPPTTQTAKKCAKGKKRVGGKCVRAKTKSAKHAKRARRAKAHKGGGRS
jgi:hypothetical protein